VVATLQQQVAAIDAETSRQVAAITAQQTLVTQQAYIDVNRTLAFAQNHANNVAVGAAADGQREYFCGLGHDECHFPARDDPSAESPAHSRQSHCHYQ
jgi:hypothetical protein